jgi:ribosomal protein L23
MNSQLNFTATKEHVPQLIQQLFGLKVNEVKQLNGYDDLNFLCRLIRTPQNTDDQQFVVCKITNSEGTAEPNVLGNLHSFDGIN